MSRTDVTRSQEIGASRAPIFDVTQLRSVRDVRRLRTCRHCNGMGFCDEMVVIPNVFRVGKAGEFYHTSCFLSAFRFLRVKQLPVDQRAKFRMSDLTVRQMRTLLTMREALS